MITNEERREIAEKVRNARTTKKSNVSFEKLTPLEFMSEIAKAIGFGKQEDGSLIDPSYSDLENRIAGLIEPDPELTCERESTLPIFTCSSCDFIIDIVSGELRFCPNWGAKVVQ